MEAVVLGAGRALETLTTFPHHLTPTANVGDRNVLARKPLSVLTTALVLSMSVLAACSGERDSLSELEGERTPSVERSVAFDGNVVRLGVIADITGPGGTPREQSSPNRS